MPEKAPIDDKSVESLTNGIFDVETKIVRSMSAFFCKSMEELANDKHLGLEKKVKLAEGLIDAVARKEAGLNAVLNTIGKILENQPETWFKLTPEAVYSVPAENAFVKTLSFAAKTDKGIGGIKIMGGKDEAEIVSAAEVNELPANYYFNLNIPRDTANLKIKNTGTGMVFLRNVNAE